MTQSGRCSERTARKERRVLTEDGESLRVAVQCAAGPEAPAWAGQEAADVLEDMTRTHGTSCETLLRHHVRPDGRLKRDKCCQSGVI